jgi:hypothetical protein
MDVPQQNGPALAKSIFGAPAQDPVAPPSPPLQLDDQGPVHRTPPNHGRQTVAAMAAIASGLSLALAVTMVSRARASWGHSTPGFSSSASPDFSRQDALNSKDLAQLDRLKPQAQAEILLGAAVRQTPGTVDQIAARVGRWYGHLALNPQLNMLVTAALNSDDLQVREAALDVQLAAYNLSKTPASVDLLVREAQSQNHARKVWALWSLGAMAGRDVERDLATAELRAHLNDTDEDSRRWAVEGLSLAGTPSAIEPLLRVLHDDPSPAVRERAACGLASSGMFTPEERHSAVPQLIRYTEDSGLDARTHAWAFQALGDITQQHLPNDSAAWRNWYETSVNSGQ